MLSLYSQNNIDPPVLTGTVVDTLTNGRIYTHTVNLNDTTLFKRSMNEFIRGWNYGTTGRQIDRLMNTNMYLQHWESGSNYDWNHHGDSNNWYLRIRPLGSGSDENVCTVHALYYEPAITVDNSESFTIRTENQNGAIFGFRDKDNNLTILNHRLVVTNSTLDTTKPILSNIWPNDELRFLNVIS
jgi:hypothetical protein